MTSARATTDAAPIGAVELVQRVPFMDPRWTLEEEDVPETAPHDRTIELVVAVLRAWVERTGLDAQVARDLAVRWDPERPWLGCDPDVCLIEPRPPEGDELTSLCLWKKGHHPPRIAVEIVSRDSGAKDYFDNPNRYASNGTRELWVFDTMSYGPGGAGGPWVLQVWRRDGQRFVRVYEGDGPARTEELDAWLVVTDEGRRLRVADDPEGQRLWLTEAEASAANEQRALAREEEARAREEEARARAEEMQARATEMQARAEAAAARERAAREELEAFKSKLAEQIVEPPLKPRSKPRR